MKEYNLDRNTMICGIMVTYYPTRQTIENIRIAKQQLDCFVLIDNTPTHVDFSLLNDLGIFDLSEAKPRFPMTPNMYSVILLRNHSNLGLSKAFNLGISIAKSLEVDYILLLDQDSKLHNDTIEKLFRSYTALLNYEVGALGCTNIQYGAPLPAQSTSPRLQPKEYVESALYQEVYLKENSGLLIPIIVINKVGKFNEAFFLDGVDYDFCLRLREYGYKVFRAKQAFITQSAGTESNVRLFGKTFKYIIRDPKRTHSIVESYVMLLKIHNSSRGILMVKFALDFVLLNFRIIFLYKDKRKHFTQMLGGLIKGLTSEISES